MRIAVVVFLISTISDPAAAETATEWLTNHYEEFPIGGGWRVVSITEEAYGPDVLVDVPQQQASGLMKQGYTVQANVLAAAACPSKSEQVWMMMPVTQAIWVHAGTSAGIFIDVDCREWGR